MSPLLNRINYTAHITFSLSWMGSIAVFLILAITGLYSQDLQVARSAYIAMEISAWFVIVPLCFASLITGVIQGITTSWGLFNYYWIAVKLFLTLASTIALLLHLQPIQHLSELARGSGFSLADETGLKLQLIADAGTAILCLLFITSVSVWKPWGKIEFKKSSTLKIKKSAGFYILTILVLLLVFILIKHIMGGGMNHH